MLSNSMFCEIRHEILSAKFYDRPAKSIKIIYQLSRLAHASKLQARPWHEAQKTKLDQKFPPWVGLFGKPGAVLLSGEGKWCSTVFMRRKLVLFCFQEKGSGALLFSGERNWCTTVLSVLKEKETGAILLSGEGNRCCTVFSRRKQDS